MKRPSDHCDGLPEFGVTREKCACEANDCWRDTAVAAAAGVRGSRLNSASLSLTSEKSGDNGRLSSGDGSRGAAKFICGATPL